MFICNEEQTLCPAQATPVPTGSLHPKGMKIRGAILESDTGSNCLNTYKINIVSL